MARTPGELAGVRDEVGRIYRAAREGLPDADPALLALSRRISRTRYAHRCLEGAAVQAYRDAGVEIAPGMQVRYIVRNASRYEVDPPWDARAVDIAFYRTLARKAWMEIAYAFGQGGRPAGGCGEPQSSVCCIP
ncbi:MAG: hypothetical protein CW742_13870 [Methanoregula sp.]|nr:MAG: hypothetical protein CW742_13870 [Methanoregula sp.]